MIRHVTRRLLREEDGIALVLAIAATAVLAIATTAVIVAGTANEYTAFASTKARSAFAVAQEALAYGEGMVYADLNSSPSVTPPTTTQNLPAQPGGATGTYVVSTADNVVWHVVGTGTVGGVTRTVSADVTPSTVETTQQGVPLWSYLYENDLSPPCVQGGAVISEPILARGDFCVKGGSQILNKLELGGTLTTSGSNTTIGTASSPIPKLVIANTSNTACSILGHVSAPGVGWCDGLHTGAYATTVGTTLDAAPSMPAVDFQGAYNTQAALTKTGCPAGLFDNNSTMDNSVADVGTILFGAAYDCKVGPSYEIKWTPSTNSLYVHGTFYFDGNLNTFPTTTVYSGQASLYFTAGVKMGGSSGVSFCGIANCTQYWNPTQNEIIIVAGCQGIATNNGCVSLNGNTTAQFGAYVNGAYTVAGGSSNMGPILCDNFQINGGAGLLIPFTTFPPGTPGQTSYTTVAGSPPTNWNG